MPKAIGFTFAEYVGGLKAYLEKIGFREMSRNEKRDEVIAHGLVFHKKTTEREKGFTYSQKGLTIRVWTTGLEALIDSCYRELAEAPELFRNSVKEEIGKKIVSSRPGVDMGWIVIVDSDNNAVYFPAPFLRTEGFVKTFCAWVRVTQVKVQNRPLCVECQKYMKILTKKSGAVFWYCRNAATHSTQKWTFLSWDHALPELAKPMVKTRRKKRNDGRKKRLESAIAQGKKPPTPARFIRAKRAAVATRSPY